MKLWKKILITGVAGAAALATFGAAAASNGSGGVTGPAIYVDGTLYRTVGTPTDFSNTGAPEHSFDTIYEFHGVQTNVATAAPGDPGFNGGRWMVEGLTFDMGDYEAALADSSVDLNQNGVLDSDEEVHAAINEGYANEEGVLKMFECPVIPLPKGQQPA